MSKGFFVALAVSVIASRVATKTGLALCVEDVLRATWKVFYQLNVFQYILVRILQNFRWCIVCLH